VTDWAVLIGYFWLCARNNHAQKWHSEKAVSACFHCHGIA